MMIRRNREGRHLRFRIVAGVAALLVGGTAWGNSVTVDPATGTVTAVFDEVGDFSWRAPASQQVELLVVGGGGGGGSGEGGGGGGGGQVYYAAAFPVVADTAYAVSVGAGGSGGTGRGNGGNGGDSVFGGITCGGGGGGGGVSANRGGVSGANTGGAQAAFNANYSYPEATGVDDAENGWYGGHMGGCVRGLSAAGGGGGAAGAGKTGTSGTVDNPGAAGDGGDGFACDITGVTVYYGCGGGGAARGNATSPFATLVYGGKGGSGGASGGDGATGNNAAATAGMVATGTGGGGGGWNQSSAKAGASGGSGIVVLRYVPTIPIVELVPSSGYLGIDDDIGLSVNVVWPENASVFYSQSASGPWSETKPTFDTPGNSRVYVKVAAEGLSDFIGSGDVAVKDPSSDNDGTFVFVSPLGSAEPPYATWATAANDLQTAIDSLSGAASPVRVIVESGRYAVSSPLNLANAQVTVFGYDRAARAVRKGCAVFDAGGVCRVALVASTKIRGCTFAGGYVYSDSLGAANNGAGVYVDGCSDASSALLADCVFSNNLVEVKTGYTAAVKGGAGVFVKSGLSTLVLIHDCTFCDNVATAATSTVRTNGGGLWMRSPTTIRRCRFERNIAVCGLSGNGAMGGAVYGDVTQHVAEDCTFVGNRSYKTAGSQSHASALYFNSGSARVTGCSFTNNTGADNGWLFCGGTVSNCVFTSNSSTYGSEVCTKIYNCEFRDNRGAIFRNANNATVRNTLFAGGLDVVAWSHDTKDRKIRFENCTFVKNAAVWRVHNNKVTGRTASFVNCLFNGNTKDFDISGSDVLSTEGAYYCYTTNSCWGMSSNIGSFVTESDACIQLDNPRFVDAANGDFALRPSSRCREAGALLSWMTGAADLAGNPRVVDPSGKASAGALPDIGCYECQDCVSGLMLLVY